MSEEDFKISLKLIVWKKIAIKLHTWRAIRKHYGVALQFFDTVPITFVSIPGSESLFLAHDHLVISIS